jgi:hypothetical protein
LFASLGASGSLVAGGASLLLLASGVIAYRGWPSVPDVAVQSRSLVVTVSGSERTRHRSSPHTTVAPLVVTGRTAVARSRRAAVTPSASTRRAPAPAAARAPARTVASAPAATSASSSTPSKASSPVRQAAAGAGDAVTQAGAGTPAEPVAKAGGDAITQAGETADGLLKP